MLEAMVAKKPVVTHLWFESWGQVGCYIDEKRLHTKRPQKGKGD